MRARALRVHASEARVDETVQWELSVGGLGTVVEDKWSGEGSNYTALAVKNEVETFECGRRPHEKAMEGIVRMVDDNECSGAGNKCLAATARDDMDAAE